MSSQDNFQDNALPLEPEGEPIPLASGDLGEDLLKPVETPASQGPSKIRTFESGSRLGQKPDTFRRPLHQTGKGASRIRTFHTKLTDGAMKFLDDQINDWLDSHEEIEVKFSSTTVGIVEGKRPEPHLIITIWY